MTFDLVLLQLRSQGLLERAQYIEADGVKVTLAPVQGPGLSDEQMAQAQEDLLFAASKGM